MPSYAMTVEALKRLLTHEPAGEEHYLERSGPGSRSTWPWPDQLMPVLDAGQRPRVLLHGPIGVGKTTELMRWGRSFEGRAVHVSLSGVRDPVAASRDVLLEVIRSWLGQGAPTASSDLKAAIARSDPTWSGLARGWTQLLAGAVREPLVLVDGLDLIPPSQIGAFFGPGTPLAMPELPPIVYAAPHTLVTVNAAAERDAGFDQIVHVRPFPVRRRTGERDAACCDWLAAGLRRRFDGLDLRVAPAVLDIAAEMSGGIPRDALRMLRAALLSAIDHPEVNARHIFIGLREVRQDLEQSLTEPEIRALRKWEPDARPRERVALIRKNALLVYEGEQRRYELPHPLLGSLLRGEGEIEREMEVQ